MRKITCLAAKREALVEEMRRDDDLIIVGEDVATMGGMFGQTEGFAGMFGKDRMVETTLNEMGQGVFGVGAAIGGKNVIVEYGQVEFASFGYSAIINEAAKQRMITNGAFEIPIVFILPQGGGLGLGGMHSSIGEGWFNNVPGLKLYTPTYPADIKGLLKYAIRERDPVCFFEHKFMDVQGEVPEPGEDFIIEPGKANILNEGSDVTIVSHQSGILNAMKALPSLRQDGISPEIMLLFTATFNSRMNPDNKIINSKKTAASTYA